MAKLQNHVRVIWENAPGRGSVEIGRGTLGSVAVASGKGRVSKAGFSFPAGPGALKIGVTDAKTAPGAFATIVTIRAGEQSFSFFLRDALSQKSPVWVPEFGVAVVSGADTRSYKEIVDDIAKTNAQSDFARYENEPEETFASAAAKNRDQYCPTWLGVARDMRIFRVSHQEKNGYFGTIEPAYFKGADYSINFVIGHGSSCRPDIKRRIMDGCLPILLARQTEQFMHYDITAFASLETRTLKESAVVGSHWLAGYIYSGGNMIPKEERDGMKEWLDTERAGREEEVVLCYRIEAVNTGKVPCYAWFKTPRTRSLQAEHRFDSKTGFTFVDDKVLSVNRLNGAPLRDEELAVLVQPGEKAVIEMIIPHAPVARKRAAKLAKLDFDKHLEAAVGYWRGKLKKAASFELPETPVNEAVKAGLLHCDLAAVGREPKDPVAAMIGVYSPIGTESSPIIQYFDSVGWHKLAERALDFFFERQLESGFIQNFARYESETGAFLWSVGEHFRYTKDEKWLRRVMPKIKKAADYILAWRERNKNAEARAKGFYGMVDGKVADPDDFYHSFFLNSGSYVGLKRIAEITEKVDPRYSAKLKKELPAYRRDIKAGFYHAQARAPVVPVPDGSWAPLMPPWVEHTGGITLYADGGNWFSHAAFASRSCLTGPIWLIVSEVLDPDEIGASFLIKTNQFPISLDNACLSQPYYCRHDFAHIKRKEVRAFLKCFYNQLTGLADKETHTFWEHYFGASQHKTHEEGWFLMQTRWMLYLEEGDSINLFSAIPANWLEDGKRIDVKNAASYFGKISFGAVSELDSKGCITVCCECLSRTRPKTVRIRIPHPENRKPVKIQGGVLDPETGYVKVAGFKGKCEVKVYY